MFVRSILSAQLKKVLPLLPLLALVYLPAFGALFVLVLVNLQTGIPIAFLTRDAAAAVQAPFYAGIVSNLGALVWSAAAAVCLFSAFLVWTWSPKHTDRSHTDGALFLLFSGLITTVLMLDDVCFLHEEVIPHVFDISQKRVFAGYGLMMCLYLVRFRTLILKTEFLLLLSACGFFAISIVVDVLPAEDFYIESIAPGFRARHLFEDGAKLLGIVSWAVYYMRVSLQYVQNIKDVQAQEWAATSPA